MDVMYTDLKKKHLIRFRMILFCVSKKESVCMTVSSVGSILIYATGSRLNGVRSDYYKVPSVVPQESHLCPVLFLFFVNDISCFKNCRYLMFANGLKIYRTVSSISDVSLFQED